MEEPSPKDVSKDVTSAPKKSRNETNIEIPKEICFSKRKGKIIDELRLI